jgi:hypothetical protein
MSLFIITDYDVRFIVPDGSVSLHCWFPNTVTLPSRLVSTKVVYYYYYLYLYYYCYHAVRGKGELAKLEMEGKASQATCCLVFKCNRRASGPF